MEKTVSDVQSLWEHKVTYKDYVPNQILLDDELLEEESDDIKYAQRSQCRTTHKRKDC